MSLNELCAVCRIAPAVRLLGTVAHCHECAESFLEPIRLKLRAKYGATRIVGKTDYGLLMLVCEICGASWAGERASSCSWCADAQAIRIEQQRADLLHPSWLKSSEGHPKYDSLSELDKRVWNRTRGQSREPQSVAEWAKRLAQAVVDGLITDDESKRALRDHGY